MQNAKAFFYYMGANCGNDTDRQSLSILCCKYNMYQVHIKIYL